MPPKKKGQKMALNDFFADTATGTDWADEMPNLPSAPAARDPTLPRKGEPGYLDSMPDRAARASFTGGPPREELPLPTVPPFTAFIGNLTYETEEDALREFFGDLAPTSVRLVKDMGKPKGFGYVEFGKQDQLKAALERNMAELHGRSIRVSVAEAPSGSRGGFGPSVADGADQWRRSTPLPAREAAPGPARRQPSYNDAAPGPERDWSAARGAKFTPSVPSTPSGLGRESSGYGREREARDPPMPSVADDVDQWRSSRPLVEAKGRDVPPHQRGIASGEASPGLADLETTWSRGSKFKTPVIPAAETLSGTASPAEERDWRASRTPSAVPSNDGESPKAAPAPLERRKLALAPRSAAPSSTSSPTTSATSKSSIFGSAKPVDSAQREAEAAKKLAARDEERKKAREEEARKEADKGRLFAEEKAKAIKEAQDKALAEATGKPVPAATPRGAPAIRGAPAARGRGGAVPSSGPAWGKRQPSNDKKVAPTVTEDGFEGVTKGRAAKPEAPAGPKRTESTTRTGFSFAAAAGRVFAEEEEGEKVEDEEVADVANGVKEVAI